jgi:membrane fusion protein (multidrug efflux system)
MDTEQKKDLDKNWKQDVVKILKSKPARITLISLVALVVLRVGINWWLERSGIVEAHSVKVAAMSMKNVDKTLKLPGNVEAIEQATLYAHVSGYLKKILVDEGDTVKKDQLLAIIDAPDVLQEYRNAKAEYSFKEVTRKRYDQLLKEKVVSQQEYDKVEADANQAKARFDNADANQNYTYVRAPFAGSLARRFKYPGDFISAPTKGGPASPLFILVNEERLRIAVNAPQKEVGSISVGHPVDIRVDTFPDVIFSGMISRVDALLDEATKTQRVLIDIANADKRLRAGMFASVVMHVRQRDHVPMIPRDALHEAGDKSYVFVVRDGKSKKIAVSVGDTESGFVSVSSPALEPKDELVISGGQALVDGDPVKVSEENNRVPQEEAPSSSPRKIAKEDSK